MNGGVQPGDPNILERPQDPDLCIRKDDTGPRCVFDGKLCLASLASDAANATGEVLAAEGLPMGGGEGSQSMLDKVRVT